MIAVAVALALRLALAPAVTEEAAQLDCARSDVDGEMDECDPDYVIGMQADGWYLPDSSVHGPRI